MSKSTHSILEDYLSTFYCPKCESMATCIFKFLLKFDDPMNFPDIKCPNCGYESTRSNFITEREIKINKICDD